MLKLENIFYVLGSVGGLSLKDADLSGKNKPLLYVGIFLGGAASSLSYLIGLTQFLVQIFALPVGALATALPGLFFPAVTVISFGVGIVFSLRKIRDLIQDPSIPMSKKISQIGLECLKISVLSALVAAFLALMLNPWTAVPTMSIVIFLSAALFCTNLFLQYSQRATKQSLAEKSIETGPSSPRPSQPLTFSTSKLEPSSKLRSQSSKMRG